MAPPLQWDEVLVMEAIVAFFAREGRWPALPEFRTSQGLPSIRVVYRLWETPARARWAAFCRLVGWDDAFPVEWQVWSSAY